MVRAGGPLFFFLLFFFFFSFFFFFFFLLGLSFSHSSTPRSTTHSNPNPLVSFFRTLLVTQLSSKMTVQALNPALFAALAIHLLIATAASASSSADVPRVANRYYWGPNSCSGSVTFSQPLGHYGLPAGKCEADGFGGSYSASCSNATGLVEYQYDNPSCKGKPWVVDSGSVRTCLQGPGALYTDFCGKDFTNHIEPSTPGKPTPGPIVSAEGPIDCPNGLCLPGSPYVTYFDEPDCKGKNATRVFYLNLVVGKQTCSILQSGYLNNNIQATCDKNVLVINQYNSGCSGKPIRSTTYTPGVCVHKGKGSAMVSCGRSKP